MNEIQIQNIDGIDCVDSRIVAKGFELDHGTFCETLSRHLFGLEKVNVSSTGAGRKGRYYLLTEKQIMMVPAICRVTPKTFEFQGEIVDAFLALREHAKSLPSDPAEQAIMLAEQLIAHKHKLLELEEKVKEDEPMVEFAKNISNSVNNVHMKSLANKINIKDFGPNHLYQWMRDNEYCCESDTYWNDPTQKALNLGVLAVKTGYRKHPKSGERINTQTTMVTPKGLEYFIPKVRGSIGGGTQLILVG